mmetsp:Transcript_1254/g.3192  ORF Transcript_1254/g.3192 Transcript_1254/m.3192 type:complete len:203 (-) Transcript_1254:269-877(-)
MRRTPFRCKGAIWRSTKRTMSSSGSTMVGSDGPYTSQSKIPTFAPSDWRAYARFTEVVDFPTPPLHELTAMMAPIPAIPDVSVSVLEGSCAVMVTSTLSTKGNSETSRSQSLRKVSLTGQAGVVSSTSKETFRSDSSILRFCTNPRVTMSCPRSGSMTAVRVFRIWPCHSFGIGALSLVVVVEASSLAVENKIGTDSNRCCV